MLSVISAVRDLNRLREITTVLVRHGFGEVVQRAGFGRKGGEKSDDKETSSDAKEATEALVLASEETSKGTIGERIRLVIQDLGPSFIKLGQIASTRADIIPASVITELKKLQDNVPPVPFADIERVITESLGAPLQEIFVSFNEKPLATASIGQVHRAVLLVDGQPTDVVVKVQRPNVGQTVQRDLELLHMMAAMLERSIPETKIYSPVGLVAQFDRSITAELNFFQEAENAQRLAQNFTGNNYVRFPKTYAQASSKTVLTQEFFAGRKIYQAVQEGVDGSTVAKRATGVVIKMIFEDGFFHADPHPGNIILLGANDDPVLGLIDLGMVGRLSPELRERTVDLMVAAVRKDPYAVADALYAIGRPTKKIDMREYRSHVALLAEKYLGKPLKDIELSAMIRDLVQGAMKYELEVPPDFMLVGKALMTIEGIGKELDPNLDILGEVSPHFMRIMKQRYSPERLGNELWRGFEQLSRVGYDVPMQMREVLDDLRLGRLAVKTDDHASAQALERTGKRLYWGMSSASLALSGAYLFVHANWIIGAIVFAMGGLIGMREMMRK
jgi:ubiquinone biosynthesis protein